MGRDCGYLALMTGIACGAEVVAVPEIDIEPHTVAVALHDAYRNLKSHALAIVSEGAKCNAAAIARYFAESKDDAGFELRITVLGHVQRGGAPSAFDRLLASRLGAAAIDCLARGEHGATIGWRDGKAMAIPFEKIVGVKKPLDKPLYELAVALAR
jgi:6-phosphofructokinase 1